MSLARGVTPEFHAYVPALKYLLRSSNVDWMRPVFSVVLFDWDSGCGCGCSYLADRVVVYEGTPAIDCTANAPQPLLSGMNSFLQQLEITFRRDPTNYRPRINKFESLKDKEQKTSGNYFFLED
jgi:hypothetical protein